MSQLSVSSLKDSHDDHDSFVRTYVKTNNEEDCVVVALRKRLESTPKRNKKPNLYNFVDDKIKNSPSPPNKVKQRIHHLALYILLTQYPQQWNDMFEAAYDLLVGLLDIICKMNVTASKLFPTIYPPMWTQQIFRLENCLAPDSLQGIIFGIDPISKDGNPSNAATGYAFTFDRQRHMIPLHLLRRRVSSQPTV